MKGEGKRRNVRVGGWSVDPPMSAFLFVFRFASISFEMFSDPGEAPAPKAIFPDQPADRT